MQRFMFKLQLGSNGFKLICRSSCKFRATSAEFLDVYEADKINAILRLLKSWTFKGQNNNSKAKDSFHFNIEELEIRVSNSFALVFFNQKLCLYAFEE